MLFQWSHSHMQHFFVVKNRAIKRGLERKNRAMCVMALTGNFAKYLQVLRITFLQIDPRPHLHEGWALAHMIFLIRSGNFI